MKCHYQYISEIPCLMLKISHIKISFFIVFIICLGFNHFTRNNTKTAIHTHVPVFFFGLPGIILEIMSLNFVFVFFHNFHTSN